MKTIDKWLFEKPWKQLLCVLAITILAYVVCILLGDTNIRFSTATEDIQSTQWILYYLFVDPGCQMYVKGGLDVKLIAMIVSTLGSILLSGR